MLLLGCGDRLLDLGLMLLLVDWGLEVLLFLDGGGLLDSCLLTCLFVELLDSSFVEQEASVPFFFPCFFIFWTIFWSAAKMLESSCSESSSVEPAITQFFFVIMQSLG